MTSQESSQPSGEHIKPESLYAELFSGYASIAATRGVINFGPLDPGLEAGNDGTLTPDGEKAYGFDYAIADDELPQTVRDRGIDGIEIGRYVSTHVDDGIWPERVWVRLQETVGITKSVTFCREWQQDEITAYLDIGVNESSAVNTGEGLNARQKAEIIEALFDGDESLLTLDGPAGDIARSLHIRLSAPDEVSIDDIELLASILTEL